MILKIKETNEHLEEDVKIALLDNLETTNYHFFDGIKHLKRTAGNGIRCAKTDQELIKFINSHQIDYMVMNFKHDYSKPHYFYHISIERESGNWSEIIFDERAFILNNDGKTLEILESGN